MEITSRINNCLVHGLDLCGCNKIVSTSWRFLIREGHDLLHRLFMYFISIYTPNKLLKYSQRSKPNYTHWRLFERTMRTSAVINIVLCSLFPIKKYDKWHPLRWARLACRHGRQPRLDQDRDVSRDVRSTVCAYWLPDYRVPLHNSPDAWWYETVW